MRELKILTSIVYVCAAGVLVAFGGGIFTAVREHQEASRPHPSVFPTPAAMSATSEAPAPVVRPGGALPVPAQ